MNVLWISTYYIMTIENLLNVILNIFALDIIINFESEFTNTDLRILNIFNYKKKNNEINKNILQNNYN